MGNLLKGVFGTNSTKIIILGFVLTILSIPVGAYFLSQRTKAQKPPPVYTAPVTKEASSSASSPLSDLAKQIGDAAPTPEPGTENTSPLAQISVGSSLDFKLILEGRPKDRYATKLYLGIAEGQTTNNPQYLLSFNIDLPDSGEYKGLSLAGLNQGKTYTAYLKGQAQIATSSSFLVTPTTAKLNNGDAMTLLTGDLNEDNVINTADLSIARKAYGSKPSSANWNANIDFNLDNVINVLDLGLLTRNIGKTGASGAWYSQPPAATSSGAINPVALSPASASASPQGAVNLSVPGEGGHWLWIPNF